MRRDDARGAVFEASLEPGKIVTLRELEAAFIDDVLQALGGNKKQAARVLGIDRRTLYRRLERCKPPPCPVSTEVNSSGGKKKG